MLAARIDRGPAPGRAEVLLLLAMTCVASEPLYRH
jgi:hypothetical protein